MTDTISSASSPIEVLRPDFPRGHFKAVLFDFDGTLSLIRRNWQAVMIPMMVDVLAETGTGETREQLAVHVEEFVMRLNGKQTIYQMMHLAEEVTSRGGTPKPALEYKHRYHDLLWEQIEHRVAGLKDQSIPPDDLTVPGSHRLLEQLRDRGLTLYLASGTDLEVRAGRRSTGASWRSSSASTFTARLDDHKSFSKAMIIERMLDDMGVRGDQLLAFGDGYVEIEETRRNGGVAVGVASEEETRRGVNAWKRNRLIRAGADIIIGDYRRQDELLHLLGL